MDKYDPGYSVMDYALFHPPPFKGKGWTITFEDIPNSDNATIINGVRYPNKAVVIHAKSKDRAQYAADMLYASNCLVDGTLPLFGVTEVKELVPDVDNTTAEYPSVGISFMRIPLVCMIAAKASFRKDRQYALFKYLLSHQIFSTDPMSFDPSHWYTERFVHFSAHYHVRCAYAVVAAYSVLEEIGLEIRASQDNPSVINGKWNPVVKQDLEGRLRKAGVNLSETFLWVRRDTPTKIERTRQPAIQAKASWAYGKIRDGEVEVIDAILYASWLRSRVSAHKFGDLARSLNFNDVLNIQDLARRLLLEKLGFWKPEAGQLN